MIYHMLVVPLNLNSHLEVYVWPYVEVYFIISANIFSIVHKQIQFSE